MSRKLKSLREEISELKLELLSEEEALEVDEAEVVHGEFRPASTLGSPHNFVLKSPVQLKKEKSKNVEFERIKPGPENSALYEQLAKAESALAARTAELVESQRSLREISSQFQLQSNYYDNLYKTLSGEFVLAVKHISKLENCLKKARIPVPPRPDLTQYDIKAPRLPAYMEPIIQDHAAQLVANAANAVNEQINNQFEDNDEGNEINQCIDPTAMLAQQMMQQQYMQQQLMMQQMYEQQMLGQQPQTMGQPYGYSMTPEMMAQYNMQFSPEYMQEQETEEDES